MPIKIGDRLKEIPHVLAVTPTLVLFNSVKGLDMIFGIDMPTFNRVSGGFVYHDGGPFLNPYDILVDDWYAKARNIRVGQTISLLNHDFHVCGIVEHGKGARLFISLNTAEDLLQVQEKASIFFVKCTDPGYADDVSDAIRQLLPKYQVLPVKEYMSLMTSNNLPGFDAFYYCHNRHRGWDRIPGHLPVHVYNHYRAHPGDRDFEVAWGFKRVYHYIDSARSRSSQRGWNHRWVRSGGGSPQGHPGNVPDPFHRTDHGMGRFTPPFSRWPEARWGRSIPRCVQPNLTLWTRWRMNKWNP